MNRSNLKKIFLIFSLVFLFETYLIQAAPIRIYGTTYVSSTSSKDNPNVTVNGILGEKSLPFYVPKGCNFKINSYGITSDNSTGVTSLVFWTGSRDIKNSLSLPSVFAKSGTYEIKGGGFEFSEGTQINARITNNKDTQKWISWFLSGELYETDANDEIECEENLIFFAH